MDETSVRVAVRIRPQLPRELIELRRICTSVTPGEPQVWLANEKAFTFDYVFDIPTFQDAVYDACVHPLIEGCFEGYNATVLAYGQTGSGKTHTMGTGFEVGTSDEELGIIPRAVDHLFRGIETRRQEAYDNNQPLPDFKIQCQFLELYNEEIIDLFDSISTYSKGKKSNIRIHENAHGGIYTVGVTSRNVTTKKETLECLRSGAISRTTASTQMNAQSSRSHAIFTINITQQRVAKLKDPDGELDAEEENMNDIETLTSKFHFVDLAGSERLKRTGATGDRAKESIAINSGLLALGNVISALGDVTKIGSHVPYRDSKLTRLLQDSLGGNSRTVMIACIAPSDCDFMETLNTLNYANRARNIKNKVVVNQDKTTKTIALLRQEIQQLSLELQDYKRGKRLVVDGVESVNDMYHETTMLQTDNNNLRVRVKAMQETIDMLTVKNTELLAEKALGNWTSSGSDGGDLDINTIVKGYMAEVERLRAKLLESEHSCEVLRKNMSRAQARLTMSPVHNSTMALTSFYESCADFEENGVKELLEVAKKDVERLQEAEAKERGRRHHTSGGSDSDNQQRSPSRADDNDLNDDKSNDEEDTSESDDGMSAQLQSDLAQLSLDINIKQRLIDELETSQKRLQSMRRQYEDKLLVLQNKIKETQDERDRVLASLGNVENVSSEKARRVKGDYEKKINEMTIELKRIQSAKKEHARLLKNQTQFERQMKTLREELNELKKAKVRLMNKNREDAQRHKEVEQRRNREISQLKKHTIKMENQCRTLEAEKRLKEAVLKRKQEEVSALRRYAKPMSDRVAGRIPLKNLPLNAMQTSKVAFSPKAAKSKWVQLEKEISETMLRKQTVTKWEQQMETFLNERTELSKKMESYIRKRDSHLAEPNLRNSLAVIDLDNEISNLEANIRYIQSNISECQQQIMLMEESKEEKSVFDTSTIAYGMSVDEMNYLFGKLLNVAISQSVLAAQKEIGFKEMEAKMAQVTQSDSLHQTLLHHLLINKHGMDLYDSICLNGVEDFDLCNVSEPSTRSSSPLESASNVEVPSYLAPSTSNSNSLPMTQAIKARRRKTATTDELLFGITMSGVNSETRVADIDEEVETYDQAPKISMSLTHQYAPLVAHVTSSHSEPSLTKKIAGVSHSSAFSSHNNNFDVTRPQSPSPSLSRKYILGGREENVFSRLTSSSTSSSQSQPDRGSIDDYVGKPVSRTSPLVCTHVAHGHSKAVLCVAATNHFLFTGSKDRTAKVWDLERGCEILSLDDGCNNVTNVRYCDRTKLVFTASSSCIKVWDIRINTGKCLKTLHGSGLTTNGVATPANSKLSESEQPMNDFVVDTYGTTLYSAAGNLVRSWDLRRYCSIGKLVGAHQAAIMCLAADDLPDGRSLVVTGSKDHYIKVFEFAALTGGIHYAKHNLEPPHYDGIQSLALHNASLFSGSRDGYIKKWDLRNAELQQSFSQPHKDWVCGLSVLPGGELLLSGCRNGTVCLWSTRTCEKLGECRAHDKPVHGVASNSSCVFTASDDNTIRFWKIKSSDFS